MAHISADGLLLVVDGRDFHLSHEHFPWFRQAPVEHVLNVKLLHGHHLHWLDLDVDLDLDGLEEPEKYPLVSSH